VTGKEDLPTGEPDSTAAAPPVPLEHVYVADASFATRAARSVFTFAIARPPGSIIFGLIFVLFPILGALLGGAPGGEWLLGLTIGVVGDIVVAFSLYGSYRRTKHAIASVAVEGARYGTGFGPTSIAMQSPLATAEISYRAFADVFVRDGFVYLKPPKGSGRTMSLLPVELFPGDTLAFVRSKITAPN
jgi:hypothetical protein